MPDKKTTASGRIKFELKPPEPAETFDYSLIDPDYGQSAIDGISEYDGTAGHDTRPDFVKADDARILRGED